METWKQQLFERAMEKGIAKDPQWAEHLNDPVPLWALLDILLRINTSNDKIDIHDHPLKPFD